VPFSVTGTRRPASARLKVEALRRAAISHGGRGACWRGQGGGMPEIVLNSAITCPECGHTEVETMPTDACQFFYDCAGCGTVLRSARRLLPSSAHTDQCRARRYKEAKTAALRANSPGSAPTRHSRSCGNDPLPTGAETLGEPFAASPSWFMSVTCKRCGQERMFNEAHPCHRPDVMRR
jgi:ribosomal protein S27E